MPKTIKRLLREMRIVERMLGDAMRDNKTDSTERAENQLAKLYDKIERLKLKGATNAD